MPDRQALANIFKAMTYTLTLVVMLSLILARSTQAAEITFHFQGTVKSFDSSLIGPDGFDGIQPLTGSYTFESTTPDLLPGSTTFGRYALSSLTHSVGGLTFTAAAAPGTSDNRITVSNQPGDNFDRYEVVTQSNMTGPLVNGRTPRIFFFQIARDGMFFDDTLSLVPPAVGESFQNPWFGQFWVPGQGSTIGSIQGEITSLTVATVPIPGAWLLMGTGLAALGWMRRQRIDRQG